MNIGSDWFTKTMLINTLSRTDKIQSQPGASNTEFNNLLSSILSQLLQQDDSYSTNTGMSGSTIPNWLSESISGNALASDNSLFKLSMDTGSNNKTLGDFSTNNITGNMGMDLGSQQTIFNSPPLKSISSLRFQSISPDKINQMLDGKLAGMGDVFVKVGQYYNIDPALLAAIAQHETGNGKSQAANEKNNIAGMMGAGGLKSYASVEDSIKDMARNLSKNYLGAGLASISKIGAKYAPIGADNDPTGLNNHWVSGVTKYFERLKV